MTQALDAELATTHGVRAPVLLGGLGAALVVAALLAVGIGAYWVPPQEVLASIGRHIGLLGGTPLDALGEDVLWQVRFPRVVLTILVGACLGCAGAVMQGTFSNPLAEPGLVGVSAGAVLGAALQIILGVALFGSWSITFFAFCGGLAAVSLVYATAREHGRTEVVTLVLAGIAVNAFAGALLGLFLAFSDDAELRTVTFWNLGSTAAATWPKVWVVLPAAVLGLLAAFRRSRALDLLALGERPARHLGVDVERLRVTMLFVVALLTAAAVAVSGVVLFVGLVVPHVVRMVAGPGHRLLLPASALAGATLLLFADLVARTVVAPAEIPLGVLTALVGSPFFFWLLRRTRARQGGWA